MDPRGTTASKPPSFFLRTLGMDGLKRSDSIDGAVAFPQAPDHFRAAQKANRREPEQAATDYGLGVADLSSGCDDPAMLVGTPSTDLLA